jgi:hypothetical protein
VLSRSSPMNPVKRCRSSEGKLPNTTNVRITISLPEALKGKLDRYAQLHSQTWGQKVDAAALVPYILAQFLANDRAFRRSEKEAATSKPGTSTIVSHAPGPTV